MIARKSLISRAQRLLPKVLNFATTLPDNIDNAHTSVKTGCFSILQTLRGSILQDQF
jgi:hypothetical protein